MKRASFVPNGQTKRGQGERGQSLAELAVSFTLLMIILAVAVDGGRVFFSYVAVREAAEEGALYGTLNPTDSSGIEQRVRTSSSNPVDLSDTGSVSVSSTTVGASCAGNGIRVTVSYNFNLTMPFIGTILGTQTFPLIAEATGTILRPPCP